MLSPPAHAWVMVAGFKGTVGRISDVCGQDRRRESRVLGGAQSGELLAEMKVHGERGPGGKDELGIGRTT